MTELIFIVEEAPEGSFLAKAVIASIFTEADSVEELRQKVKEELIKKLFE